MSYFIATSGIDLIKTSVTTYYPRFMDYAKVTVLYIGAAGVMIQVIKSLRG